MYVSVSTYIGRYGAAQIDRNPLYSQCLSYTLSSRETCTPYRAKINNERAFYKDYGTAPSCIGLAPSSEPHGSRSHSMLQILLDLYEFIIFTPFSTSTVVNNIINNNPLKSCLTIDQHTKELLHFLVRACSFA